MIAATIHSSTRTRSIDAMAPSNGPSTSSATSSAVMMLVPSGAAATSPSASTTLITSSLPKINACASSIGRKTIGMPARTVVFSVSPTTVNGSAASSTSSPTSNPAVESATSSPRALAARPLPGSGAPTPSMTCPTTNTSSGPWSVATLERAITAGADASAFTASAVVAGSNDPDVNGPEIPSATTQVSAPMASTVS